MKTKQTEQKLERTLCRARNELDKIRSARTRKENLKYLGKCFKFLNSYGSGDKWYLYKRITKSGEIMQAHDFQHTSTGRFESHLDTYVVNLESYEEIEPEEFWAAWADFIKKLETLGHI